MKIIESLLVVFLVNKGIEGTIFGIRIVDAPARPSYQPPKPNILEGVTKLKANALRFKGDVLYSGADILDPPPRQTSNFRVPGGQTSAQLNFLNAFSPSRPSYGPPGYSPPPPNTINNNNNNGFNNGNNEVISINNQGPFNNNPVRDPDVIVDGRGNPGSIDTGLLRQAAQQMLMQEQKMTALRTGAMRVKDANSGPRIRQCEERFTQLVGDIFIGNEMVPDVIETPPLYPLELTYRTVRTFPGMRVTAETTRFKPMVEWPAEDGAYYTLILSNLDINTRRNRTLSEFWHWFVANIPGDSVDDGEVIFDLLFPLVLPEGDGDHRFGYFVLKQPRRLDYSSEGGPTDSCSPNMSKGRGPRRSVKDLIRRYDLELTASTFLIIDSDPTSLEIACEWQRCMGGQVRCRPEEVNIF